METSTSAVQETSLLDKGKLFIKAVIIFGMALGLWIPTYIIMGLVKERAGRQKEAIADISNKWAGKQTVTGPMLMLPYNVYSKDEKGVTIVRKGIYYYMPDKSEIKSVVYPEKRHRGIYQVIVYRSDISINGKFKPLEQQKIPPENILWNEAACGFNT